MILLDEIFGIDTSWLPVIGTAIFTVFAILYIEYLDVKRFKALSPEKQREELERKRIAREEREEADRRRVERQKEEEYQKWFANLTPEEQENHLDYLEKENRRRFLNAKLKGELTQAELNELERDRIKTAEARAFYEATKRKLDN